MKIAKRLENPEARLKELEGQLQNLCQAHGTVLMQRGRLRDVCKRVLTMIGSHQVYDKGAKELIEKVLRETELDYESEK